MSQQSASDFVYCRKVSMSADDTYSWAEVQEPTKPWPKA